MEKTQNTVLLKQLFKDQRNVSSKIISLYNDLNYHYGVVTLKMQNHFTKKASLDESYYHHVEMKFDKQQSPYELRKREINKELEKEYWKLREEHEKYKLDYPEDQHDSHLFSLYENYDNLKEELLKDLESFDKDNLENDEQFLEQIRKRINKDKNLLIKLASKIKKHDAVLEEKHIRFFDEEYIEELIYQHLDVVTINNYKQLQLSRNQFITTNYHVLTYLNSYRKIVKTQDAITLYTEKLNEVDKEIQRVTKEADQLSDNAFVKMQEDQDVHMRISGLKMYFGGLKAVDDLTFDIKRGEIFSLIGPNGAGKTTVFNCITQFYKPTAGEVYINNNLGVTKRLNNYKVHDVIKQGIARTFQNVELIDELTVFENLLVGSHSSFDSNFLQHMVKTRKARMEEKILHIKAFNILNRLNLSEHMFAYPKGLPYGTLKRVELARALMTDPEIIILDEPAAGLNESETKELSTLIRQLNKELNLTIFLVEHDMSLVMDISDRICVISFGKMLAIGSPQEIQKDPIVQEAYLGGSRDE